MLVEGCLKLIDFGIAKAIPQDTTNIQRDYQTGTVNYMAPEAIMYVERNGTKMDYLKQGRSSDVWSLGCILYRLVYGFPPFGNLPLVQKLHCIVSETYVIEYGQCIDPSVLLILKKCLIRDSYKRISVPDLLSDAFLHPGTFQLMQKHCRIRKS